MATLGEIISQALAEGGIDATTPQATVWGNDRYRRLVAGAKWRRLQRDLGATVAEQAVYSLADDVVDLLSLRVDGSAPYKLISIEELWELQAGDTYRITRRGLFAPAYDDDSEAESFELFPAPTEAGKTITGLVAVQPPALAVSDTPKVPEDFHMTGLKAGIIADGLMLIDEDHASAAVWEQQFQESILRLRSRRISRVGSGPARVRLVR